MNSLLPQHLADLRASGLTDEMITAAGIRSETDPAVIAKLLGWKSGTAKLGPCMVIPHVGPNGEPTGYHTIKPDTPITDGKGRVRKYECVKGRETANWADVRGYRCWCKLFHKDDGELITRVAVRIELFAQLSADPSLRSLTQRAFATRCKRYGVGQASTEDRPGGLHAVVLDDGFVADLLASYSDSPQEVRLLEVS